MRPDARQVLLARAHGAHEYAVQLIEKAGRAARDPERPRSHAPALADMAAENLQIATRAIAAAATKRRPDAAA